MATIPPLDLSTVQRRYPRLFQEYSYLSAREKEGADDMMDIMGEPLQIDPKTGLCTKIMMNDFTEGLEPTPNGCPMTTGSDAYKFLVFLWKCLSASESGSIGGDACRQYDVLANALNDTLSMTTVASKFEHLLGWTGAALNHELHALLYRGDPDRNRLLFKRAADEWKKVLEKTSTGSVEGINEAYHKFAVRYCEGFQKLLKDAKKEYGEYANYPFNFIKKPRAKKSPPVAAPAVSTTATSGPSEAAADTSKQVTVSVIKPSKDAKLGLGLGRNSNNKIQVTSIAPGSLFDNTDIKVSMAVQTINGQGYATFEEGVALIMGAEGNLTIVGTSPDVPPPVASGTQNSSPSTTMAVKGGVVSNGAEGNLTIVGTSLDVPPPVTSGTQNASPSTTMAVKGGVVSNQKENSVPAAKNTLSEPDDEPKPWEMEGWVPTTKGGKQKTPNMIRNELQKYIDQCKSDGSMTQTRIIEKMGVNNNTFRRFMNPKTYKDQWSAAQNGTYWAAGRLLAEVKYEQDKAKKSGAKRKSGGGPDSVTKKAKGLAISATSSKMSKAEALAFIDRINAVQVPIDTMVYDSCPQVVAKIKAFLERDGMTKAILLQAFGNINSNSMGRFLSGKGQDQCGNVTYKAAYVFFERVRIMEGKAKTAARLKNESERPGGFSLKKSRGGTWKYLPGL